MLSMEFLEISAYKPDDFIEFMNKVEFAMRGNEDQFIKNNNEGLNTKDMNYKISFRP